MKGLTLDNILRMQRVLGIRIIPKDDSGDLPDPLRRGFGFRKNYTPYNETPTIDWTEMDHAEFVQKTNDIAQKMTETTDKETKEKLMHDFFAVGIDMWNEHIAGDVEYADGRTATLGTIDL